MRLYHSSTQTVEHPDTHPSRKYLDFGRGFYLTTLYDQAVKYAERFRRRGLASAVSTLHQDCSWSHDVEHR